MLYMPMCQIAGEKKENRNMKQLVLSLSWIASIILFFIHIACWFIGPYTADYITYGISSNANI